MPRISVRPVAALLLAGLAMTATAAPPFTYYEQHEEGWFWYDDPPPPMTPPEPAPPPPPPAVSAPPAPAEAPSPGPAVFSVAWLKAKLPELRETAIDDPTPENVRTYLYAQRVMFDKADQFTQTWQDVLRSDPLLDENARFPFSTAFRSTFMRGAKQASKAAVRGTAQQAGLFFFYRADCDFCHRQLPVVQALAREFGFHLSLVSMDGGALPGNPPFLQDAGQSRTLNIQVVPALVLAVPPNTFIVVTRGYLAQSAQEKRILLAGEDHGLVPEALHKQAHPLEQGLLSQADIEAAGGWSDDPKVWVRHLRESMGADEPAVPIGTY